MPWRQRNRSLSLLLKAAYRQQTMARATTPGWERRSVNFDAGWHALCTSVRGRPESRESAVVRAHSSKNRARNY